MSIGIKASAHTDLIEIPLVSDVAITLCETQLSAEDRSLQMAFHIFAE